MGVVKKQAVTSSIISYLGVGLAYFILLVLYPKFLSKEEIGLVRVIIDMGVLFGALSFFAFPNTANKFWPLFEERKAFGLLKTLSILWPSIGFLVFLILFFSFKDFILSGYSENSPEVITYYPIAIAIGFFLSLFNCFAAVARVFKNIVVANFLREVSWRILTIFLLVLVILEWTSFEFFLQSQFLIYGFGALVMFGYMLFKTRKEPFKFSLNALSRDDYKDISKYAGSMFLLGISSRLLGIIDTLMLADYEGLATTGVYAISFFIGTVIQLPKRALSSISGPFISKAIAVRDFKEIGRIYKDSALSQLIVGGVIFLMVWVNLDTLFEIMPNGAEYTSGKWVVFFIALTRLFDMAMGVNLEIINNSKFYRFNLITIVSLVVILVVSNMIFIPILGLTGAALATLISYALYNLVGLSIVRNKFKLLPFSKGWWVSGILFLTLLLLFHLTKDLVLNPWVQSVVYSSLVVAVYGYLILKTNLAPSLKDIVRKVLPMVH